MFYEISGERFREVMRSDNGIWVISYENPGMPRFVSLEAADELTRIEPPEEFLARNLIPATKGEQLRLDLIADLLKDDMLITDANRLTEEIQKIAIRESTTPQRIRRLFYRHLSGRSMVEKRKSVKKALTKEQEIMKWAIQKFYYSAKRMSLQTAYDMMLLTKFTDADGHLVKERPTWNTFHYFFYNNRFHQQTRSGIRRNGLTDYQRNHRPIFGTSTDWKKKIGCYQLDATIADIYLVSSIDRSQLLGRPNVFLAVDTVSGLIAGFYVGMEGGEQASMACLQNAAMDKVTFCQQYGIEIQPAEWPSKGLPGEIITDKGTEYNGSRTLAFLERFDMEQESLPPFRPDEKPLVEQAFDLLQEKYKPLLRGKGVVEADANERWMTNYKKEAVLTLEDFRKVLIHCILYLNNCRIQENPPTPADVPNVASSIWHWFEEQGESVVIPVNIETLKPYCLKQTELVLSRRGLNRTGLIYTSERMRWLLNRHSIGDKVTVAYDEDDVSEVFLLEESEWIPFQLSTASAKYQGVTGEEYRLNRQNGKSLRRELEAQDEQGRVRLLSSIQNVIHTTEGGKDNHEI